MAVTPPEDMAWFNFLGWIRKFRITISPEEREQIKLFCWINTVPELQISFHIANERKCTRIVGQILKLMGVRPGVPDICVPIARGGYHGLYIELKAGKNKPTDYQAEYLAKLTANGYMAVCVVGHLAARAVIETYMGLEPVV